ncbi:hypothetical protein TNCV_2013671 [Trichonephila clavipes]|nr:hypothetical protein TNCV_2013671 [Trichonephila clavipes]
MLCSVCFLWQLQRNTKAHSVLKLSADMCCSCDLILPPKNIRMRLMCYNYLVMVLISLQTDCEQFYFLAILPYFTLSYTFVIVKNYLRHLLAYYNLSIILQDVSDNSTVALEALQRTLERRVVSSSPCIPEDLPCRAAIHVKTVESSNVFPLPRPRNPEELMHVKSVEAQSPPVIVRNAGFSLGVVLVT